MGQSTPVCAQPTRKNPQGRTGTTAGYQAHQRAREKACQPCITAWTAKGADRKRRMSPEELTRHRAVVASGARRRRDADPEKAGACVALDVRGTVAGYAAHMAARQTPCLACRDAAQAPGAYPTVCARPTPHHPDGRTGTGPGYHAHIYAEEPACAACLEAVATEQAATRRRAPDMEIRDRLWSKYRITLEGYRALLARQDGKCAVCGTTDPGDARAGRFHIDHDHACCPGSKSCGKCVRGLLCRGCNTALGNFGDDPDRLLAAAAYLMSSRKEAADASA